MEAVSQKRFHQKSSTPIVARLNDFFLFQSFFVSLQTKADG